MQRDYPNGGHRVCARGGRPKWPPVHGGGHVTAVASVPCVCFWSSFSNIWVLIKGIKDIFKNSLDQFFSCNFFLIKRSSKQKFIWLVVSWNI